MKPSSLRTYTCSDYREEMRLLGLKRKLKNASLSEEQRAEIRAEIRLLEQRMEMA